MLTILTLTIGIYFFAKGFRYFCLGCYRLLKPLFLCIFFGIDSAYESELKRTKEYKNFEDELKKLL